MTRPGRVLPRVGVVLDLGSAAATTIVAAANRLCRIVFITDYDRPSNAGQRETIEQLADVVDVTAADPQRRVELVRDAAVDGLVTYSEYQLGETARLAAAVGLPHHAESLIPALIDKRIQRATLHEHHVQDTGCAVLGDDPAEALRQVGVPAVIKPRVGAGSLHTRAVTTEEEFLAVAADLVAGVEFVAEQMLTGDESVAGTGWGDYVSVESVHTARGSQQVCITGKLPLAEGFRETGMLLPATTDAATSQEILALEAAAIKALGIRHGITHTEIKLTSQGPRIIEVNGRLGGYVPEILKRATGINLVRTALELALGREPALPEARFKDVTYQVFLTPPAVVGKLASVSGADDLAALPGVRAVQLNADPGRVIDWREGTQSHLGVVAGSAPDHNALLAVAETIRSTFRPTFA